MKKYLLIALLLLTMTLVACGSEKTKDTDVKNPVEDQTIVEVPNDTEDPVEPDNTEEPVKPDDTEEPVEPDDTEEPVVEMVDWETWATQADNDEVCLVVWNEELNIQEVMLTLGQSGKAYKVQEGDRFAIPYRENIEYVNILYENGEIVDLYIGYENDSGEAESLCYCFK